MPPPLSEWPKLKKPDHTQCCEDVEQLPFSYSAGGNECQTVQPFAETAGQVLQKINKCRPCDSAIPLRGIYPRKVKCIHTKSWTWLFMAAFFVIAKNCPLTGEEMSKWCLSVQWMLLYSGKEWINGTTWMNLKLIILNKRSQTALTSAAYRLKKEARQKKRYMISFVWRF